MWCKDGYGMKKTLLPIRWKLVSSGPHRNFSIRPPELSVKCETAKTVTFMTTPSNAKQLVVLIPHEQSPDVYDMPYTVMEESDVISRIFKETKSNYTFWTTSLNEDGTPSLWLQGPEVREWESPQQKKYDIKKEILTYNYVNGSQEIQAEFTWNATDESDYCFHVLNYCDKKILGDYFDKTIEPYENRSVVVEELPLGDSCTFRLYGKYGMTNFTYRTPECYEIDGCEPLPEKFSNVSMEISESSSGSGWNVRVCWNRPHVTPLSYNTTLYADDVYNVLLPGSKEAGTRCNLFLFLFTGEAVCLGVRLESVHLLDEMTINSESSARGLQEKPCKDGVLVALKKEFSVEDRWEVEGSRLLLHEVVGEGAFGLVRRATLAPGREVAVKMLKDFPSAEEVRSFRTEMELMKSVGAHPHVVSLLGCCSGRRPLIVVEYCSLGDLLTFLRSCWDVMLSKRNAKYCSNNKLDSEYRLNSHKDIDNDTGHRAVVNKLYDIQEVCDELTFPDLLSYCRQIAMGMEFLASSRVVHRDLAARNILMTGDKTLKIADFGLSRDVYQENQYRQKGNGKMPVKWMALESLTHRIFTTQSDVWSFGVVMWEVVTVGGAPYPAVAASRLPRLLRAGYRMPCPNNCTPQLYEVMMLCWRARPCERPTFTQLRMRLDELLTAACADRYLTLDLPADQPSLPTLPALPDALPSGKNLWERGESYERPNALSNHYSSPPATQPA
ncbi:tyrosine-protein kinase receptor torso-like [Battus philenor]|uniref:tyrosine-protein kinase receptor torso-like n=1 Tax=Battus philenor TaxID=42288 RepID=UPI0035D07CC1